MIRLEVYGTPAPQGSKSAFVRGGRPVLVDGTSKKGRESHAAWRQAVATAARDWQERHHVPLLDEPLWVCIEFWLPKPASLPKWRWLADRKPDIDKLTRAVLDSLSGIVIVDDSRVVHLVVSKEYAIGRAPGAVIQIDGRREREEECGKQRVAREKASA